MGRREGRDHPADPAAGRSVRPGATRVESLGSFWWLDDDTGEYLRTPKHEGPRRGHQDVPPVLDDWTWLPMRTWTIREGSQLDALVILTPDGQTIAAPLDPALGQTREVGSNP